MSRELSPHAPSPSDLAPTTPERRERPSEEWLRCDSAMPEGGHVVRLHAEDNQLAALVSGLSSPWYSCRQPYDGQVRKEPQEFITSPSGAEAVRDRSLLASLSTDPPRAIPSDVIWSEFETSTEPSPALSQLRPQPAKTWGTSEERSVFSAVTEKTSTSTIYACRLASVPEESRVEDASSDGLLTKISYSSESTADQAQAGSLSYSMKPTKSQVPALLARSAQSSVWPRAACGSTWQQNQAECEVQGSGLYGDSSAISNLIRKLKGATTTCSRRNKKSRPRDYSARPDVPGGPIKRSKRVSAKRAAGRKFAVLTPNEANMVLNMISALRNTDVADSFLPLSHTISPPVKDTANMTMPLSPEKQLRPVSLKEVDPLLILSQVQEFKKSALETARRGSYGYTPIPRYSATPSSIHSASEITYELQNLWEAFQQTYNSEEAPQHLPMVYGGANSFQQNPDVSPQWLQSQRSFPLCSSNVTESLMDIPPPNFPQSECIASLEERFLDVPSDSSCHVDQTMKYEAQSSSDEQRSMDKMESPSQNNLSFEFIDPDVYHSNPIYAYASNRAQPSSGKDPHDIQWNIGRLDLLPLTTDNITTCEALKPGPVAQERNTEASFGGDFLECSGSIRDKQRQNELFSREKGISFDDECREILSEEWVRRRESLLIRRSLLEDELQLKDLETKQMNRITHAGHEIGPMWCSSEPSELQVEEEAVANVIPVTQWLDEERPPDDFEPETEVQVSAGWHPVIDFSFQAQQNEDFPGTSAANACHSRHASHKCSPSGSSLDEGQPKLLTSRSSVLDSNLCFLDPPSPSYLALPSIAARSAPKSDDEDTDAGASAVEKPAQN
ncbi:uncharacterized protein LOC144101390 [Amblyomma americanum]